ncbi:LuxR family two component transcriptional regulator [Jatrophihabitans sp. GAS493]|uniref:response regulator n=1 Tax=Jatrophihabitans sp. GAS493 TaxID=1907575 RepID=UPI000BB6B629|nr:response regulator transcription factor [Jatrophihabitans sp. GAS493]SOD74597.1 LuxR family two component transcriptional regulator [Jatrophihabitans sp. GAS493]
MIRVLVVDDHQLVRAGLATLLNAAPDIEVVGEAADGAAGADAVLELLPDVVLMDLSMPVLDGVGAIRRISAEAPPARVVALTSFSDHQRVSEALTAGAVGYQLKDCTPAQLLAAVRAAAVGQVPLDPRVAGALLPTRQAQPAETLSAREVEVLRLTASGLANKQIGRRLGISESTVKVHLSNIFKRIGVTDRTSAAMWARENLPAE